MWTAISAISFFAFAPVWATGFRSVQAPLQPGWDGLLVQGPCDVSHDVTGSCVSSPGYPDNYPNNIRCAIQITQQRYLSVEHFSTEGGADFLTVNGRQYSGTQAPSNGFMTGEITWDAGKRTSSSGWKLCFQEAAPTPEPVLTPEPAPVPRRPAPVPETPEPVPAPEPAPCEVPPVNGEVAVCDCYGDPHIKTFAGKKVQNAPRLYGSYTLMRWPAGDGSQLTIGAKFDDLGTNRTTWVTGLSASGCFIGDGEFIYHAGGRPEWKGPENNVEIGESVEVGKRGQKEHIITFKSNEGETLVTLKVESWSRHDKPVLDVEVIAAPRELEWAGLCVDGSSRGLPVDVLGAGGGRGKLKRSGHGTPSPPIPEQAPGRRNQRKREGRRSAGARRNRKGVSKGIGGNDMSKADAVEHCGKIDCGTEDWCQRLKEDCTEDMQLLAADDEAAVEDTLDEFRIIKDRWH